MTADRRAARTGAEMGTSTDGLPMPREHYRASYCDECSHLRREHIDDGICDRCDCTKFTRIAVARVLAGVSLYDGRPSDG